MHVPKLWNSGSLLSIAVNTWKQFLFRQVLCSMLFGLSGLSSILSGATNHNQQQVPVFVVIHLPFDE